MAVKGSVDKIKHTNPIARHKSEARSERADLCIFDRTENIDRKSVFLPLKWWYRYSKNPIISGDVSAIEVATTQIFQNTEITAPDCSGVREDIVSPKSGVTKNPTKYENR